MTLELEKRELRRMSCGADLEAWTGFNVQYVSCLRGLPLGTRRYRVFYAEM
jgi:hypothetical protein